MVVTHGSQAPLTGLERLWGVTYPAEFAAGSGWAALCPTVSTVMPHLAGLPLHHVLLPLILYWSLLGTLP